MFRDVILSDNLTIVSLETVFDVSLSDTTYYNQHDAFIINKINKARLKGYQYIKATLKSNIVIGNCIATIISWTPYGDNGIIWISAFSYAHGRKYDIAIFPPNMSNYSFRVRTYNL